MCRLYGFRANEPTRVECSLVRAQNALLVQSRHDLRGRSSPDGWGIAVYMDGRPEVERRVTAAYHDLHFATAASRVFAKTVVAHVREATVGGTAVANSHPFQHDRWVMAHNGTVRGFDRLEPGMVAETDADLITERTGSTDSELAFLWLLTRLRRAGVDLDGPPHPAGDLGKVVAESVRALSASTRALGLDKPERLNFLLTDGHSMIASRWNNSLHWIERHGVQDCETCGAPHVDHTTNRDYRAVAIASEPISSEAWQQVPEHSLLIVDEEITVKIERI